jgi:hypothetical protein
VCRLPHVQQFTWQLSVFNKCSVRLHHRFART